MSIPIETVRTDRFSMDYFRFGKGEKTLVILPGLSVQSVMGAADAVAAAYESLTDRYTVYVFDRRAQLPETYPVREMARDTAEAMQALGLEKVCLFGASQGGMMAQVLAIEYPELVGRMVLGSTAARVDEEQYRELEEWIRLAKEGDREGLYLAFGREIYPPAVFEQYREALLAAAGTVTDAELARFVILAEGTKGFDVVSELDRIRCPVMAVGVFDDAVLGADATMEIAVNLDFRGDFRLYMYTGYGHAAYDTAPDYRQRILRFFDGTVPAADPRRPVIHAENKYMQAAVDEAVEGITQGHGGPFGCVIVKDGEIVGRGHNRVVADNDPTCHGEIAAIRDAGGKLGTFDLSGCELYTTGEPCPMCLCACLWAKIGKVYYGCTIDDNELIGFRDEDFDELFGGREAFGDYLTCVDREACLSLFDAYLRMGRTEY